jgi:hypothetical protein
LEVFILSPENDKKLQEAAQQFDAAFAPLLEKFPEALRPLSAKFHQQFDQKMAAFQQGESSHADELNEKAPAADCDATNKRSDIKSRFEQYELPIENAQSAIIKFQAYAEALYTASDTDDASTELLARVREFSSKSIAVTDLLAKVYRQLSWFVHGSPFETSLEEPLNPAQAAESFREKYAAGVRLEWLPRLASETHSVFEKVERRLGKLKRSYESEFSECLGASLNEADFKVRLGGVLVPPKEGREIVHRDRVETLSSLITTIRDELRPELRHILEQALIAALPTANQSPSNQHS